MRNLAGYLIVGASAAAATAVATPIIERVARRKNWMAEPDERRAHPVPTPDVGGIAFFVGLIVALVVAFSMDRFQPLLKGNSEIIGVVLAAVFITALGFVDDIKELSAPMKV
ncbi:undecaprenyl/decaprenyl-phosphate alpha-N-acetylglucosaminyl 1-phosphate transferase, partial [bacterium]|nr:undecaprenyl/decaprenyl-phosphate alpha-N-acetylglucosaminyl 1-phosphate transferase [bacterium]